ncbi:MAG: hypothetical protein A2506_13865 [Elusimicrobia bacterium RIFOXYD12_FULL_66_9]|nr:MAG: hypothetical protein A2506_13865 [Elusimicrobia bacterium RIFOXYD12_FULL_66_9]
MGHKRPPTDWHALLKSLPYQPAPLFILLGLLAEPFARISPWLLRASCEGRPRATLAAIFLFVYVAAGMPLACAAYYLGFARRRVPPGRPKSVADLSFILVLIVSVVTLAVLGRGLAARWDAIQPALTYLRDACWN